MIFTNEKWDLNAFYGISFDSSLTLIQECLFHRKDIAPGPVLLIHRHAAHHECPIQRVHAKVGVSSIERRRDASHYKTFMLQLLSETSTIGSDPPLVLLSYKQLGWKECLRRKIQCQCADPVRHVRHIRKVVCQ